MSDIVEKELWDHYSELPNPMWYMWKKEQEDEKNNICNNVFLGELEEKEKYVEPLNK
jgi:hypothetical protein